MIVNIRMKGTVGSLGLGHNIDLPVLPRVGEEIAVKFTGGHGPCSYLSKIIKIQHDFHLEAKEGETYHDDQVLSRYKVYILVENSEIREHNPPRCDIRSSDS